MCTWPTCFPSSYASLDILAICRRETRHANTQGYWTSTLSRYDYGMFALVEPPIGADGHRKTLFHLMTLNISVYPPVPLRPGVSSFAYSGVLVLLHPDSRNAFGHGNVS